MTKIHCPTCTARYNVPDEKLGKRVKCAKCGEHFSLTPTAATPAPAPAAREDDFFPDLAPLQSGVTVAAAPAATPSGGIPAPYADHQRTGRAAVGPAQLARYFDDVFRGFGRILAHPWELLTLVAVCFICLLQIPASFTCFGGIISLIITGWYLSFLLRTVQSGANREDGLPDFSLTEGQLEGIIIPCVSFLVVRLIVALPVIAALIYAAQENRVDADVATTIGVLAVLMPEMALITALLMASDHPNLAAIAVPPLLIGLAAVPMLVLVVAIEGINALVRVDLMLTTIVRTLPGYIAATVIYFAALGSAVAIGYAIDKSLSDHSGGSVRSQPAVGGAAAVSDPNDPNAVAAATPGAGPAGATPTGPKRNPDDAVIRFAGSLLGQAVSIVVGVITSVFAMRAIGLYYAHFKRRFAWQWE